MSVILEFSSPFDFVLLAIFVMFSSFVGWPEPEKFKPTRFLDVRSNPYAFFPFGGGTRRCIGAAFATFQMKVVLAELLKSVELAPAPGYVAKPIRSSIALAPSEGMPVRITRNLSQSD